MKTRLLRLLGADRPKVIAVFGATRKEVESAVRHARAGATLPVWAYCAEPAIPVEGCELFVSGPDGLRSFRQELRSVWVALSIVAWTRSAGALAKLFPFTLPPFRILVLNEAGDFFAARPAAIAGHLKRRLRDGCIAGIRRAVDVTDSVIYRGGERILDALRWTGESLLAALAILARCVPPLSRHAVARLQKRRPADSGLRGDGGESIEIAIPGRAWRRKAVIRALTESDAEFIVFRRGGETGSAGPLIRMARKTEAFAVAKQVAHSAWRKRVVAKHPFRRLQDGEVAEVFAPFSSLIVVRRDLFLRLGCPRAVTYGAALMLLFWKASAAGLRSVTAGFDDLVTDEPAMDLEDAELALRVTFFPVLRGLEPTNPFRLRGNVAWSPAYARAFRGKPRVLIVSPYLPFPLAHGGAVRIFNLCREMSADIDFVLACFRESGETVHYAELHEVFREVYIVDADEKHADNSLPKQVVEYRNGAMSDLIRRLCLNRRVDLVQLEYTQLAEYRDDTGAVPVLLVEHDITFTLHRQISELTGEIGARREFQRWLEFEREALQCTSAVWTMSEQDKAVAVKYGASQGRTRVVPNGVDLRRFQPEVKEEGPLEVLFVGSFRHLPNLLAFEELQNTIMPEVWQSFPNAVLHVIAGPNHERVVEVAGKGNLLTCDPRIHIHGFVEDVRPAYRRADVVVIPLPVSAGTNIKLMEAMACARAIVSTPAGCAGLKLVHGRELMVAGLGPDFAGAIVGLLADEVIRSRMAAEARRTAEIRFGWDSIARDALKAYASMTAEPLPVAAKSAKG